MMMKPLLLSTGVISSAVILKLSLPVMLDILKNDLPHLWSNLTLSWFQPPYLYILINCIILSIVASYKLHPPAKSEVTSQAVAEEVEVKVEDSGFDFVAAVVAEEVVEEVKEVVFGYTARKDVVVESGGVCGDEGEFELLKSVSMSDEKVVPKVEEEEEEEDVVVVAEERMPYSVRFGHRKAVKASPEGKTMLKKVSRPRRQETLESTWRTLTEGRSMPLTRHLRKSDTFTGAQQQEASSLIKKSDTFSYGSIVDNPSPGSSGKLRREPSLSQDDLNRRVEAFIKKFNEEMRLQCQESVNQARGMVPHGYNN